MELTKKLNNQDGFTLVEIIAVLIILGILAAVAVPRYINLESSAKERAIDAGIAELNGRENLVWANQKISASAPATTDAMDTAVMTAMGAFDLGDDYTWDPAPTGGPGGNGGLIFQEGPTATLTRASSGINSPAVWSR